MKRPPPDILLVEDNDLDAEKVVRAFTKLGVARAVKRARNGLEALETLRARGARRTSHVVLLDLNMPCMNGFEFLEELRADPDLTGTPVFVLTTSGRERDVAAAHRHHVAGYMLKPQSMAEMLATLKAATLFWDVCRMPDAA